jgi:hypothetical protein
VEWSPRRDRHDLKPSICESGDIAAGGIHRDAGQAVGEPVPTAQRGIEDRALWRPPAQVRRSREMAIPVGYRESPHYAPDRDPSPHVRPFTILVVGQHFRRLGRHLLHHSRRSLLPCDFGRRNIIVRVSIPNSSISGSPTFEARGGSPDRSNFRERKAETDPRVPKVQACEPTPSHSRRRARSTDYHSKRPRATGARTVPGSPSETEHIQCALRVRGPPKPHRSRSHRLCHTSRGYHPMV